MKLTDFVIFCGSSFSRSLFEFFKVVPISVASVRKDSLVVEQLGFTKSLWGVGCSTEGYKSDLGSSTRLFSISLCLRGGKSLIFYKKF